MRIFDRIISFISSLLGDLFALLELFLFLRMLLKFLNANSLTPVVSLTYQYSDIFVSPFKSIFQNVYWPSGHLIEVSTFIAIVGYAIAFFIVSQFLRPSPRY